MLYPTQIRWVENHKYLLTLAAESSGLNRRRCGGAGDQPDGCCCPQPGPDPRCSHALAGLSMFLLPPSLHLVPSPGSFLPDSLRLVALLQPVTTASSPLATSLQTWLRTTSKTSLAFRSEHPRTREGDGAACARPQINTSTRLVNISPLPPPLYPHLALISASDPSAAEQIQPVLARGCPHCHQRQPGEDTSSRPEFKDP